jgi:hypothetical protein
MKGKVGCSLWRAWNMPKKSPPWSEHPAWTEAKFWGFLRSGLRAAFRRYPPKYETLKAAERPYTGPNKRQKKEYQCASCEAWFKRTEVEVDHIVPTGPLRKWEDLEPFVKGLAAGAAKQQVLCKEECHKAKTAREREERKK